MSDLKSAKDLRADGIPKDKVNDVKVSIIVPCYNVETKIGRCFASLEKVGLAFGQSEFEVIFVDDCSSDRTVEKIRDRQVHHPQWSLVALEVNSGSPSRPRNVGVAASKGEFVFFLDPDDEVHAGALLAQYRLAVDESADLVRTALELAELGKPNVVVDRVAGFKSDAPPAAQISQIVRAQSTTNSTLVRRSLLLDHSIKWPEDLHMGEDTIFLLSVLTHARKMSYLDEPGIIYHKTVSMVRSATQQYAARDLASHLQVWERAEQILARQG
jgi:glycosyltransferase involved in cell wall biosynthesis